VRIELDSAGKGAFGVSSNPFLPGLNCLRLGLSAAFKMAFIGDISGNCATISRGHGRIGKEKCLDRNMIQVGYTQGLSSLSPALPAAKYFLQARCTISPIL